MMMINASLGDIFIINLRRRRRKRDYGVAVAQAARMGAVSSWGGVAHEEEG